MKSNKIFFLMAAAIMTLGFTACTDDNNNDIVSVQPQTTY